jgi:hypothetical protein
VVAAQDALQGENYDIHWPLSMAVELLERASNQLDEEALRRPRLGKRTRTRLSPSQGAQS